MTNEEAIRYAKDIHFCTGCPIDMSIDNCESCKVCEHRAFFEMAIKALEAQNKYRWHDLRKDPNDLPNDDSIEYVVCVEYRNGKRECTVGCLDMGGEMMLLPTLGNWIGNSYHIIAWREIEPFGWGSE